MPFGTNSQHDAFRSKVKDAKGEMDKKPAGGGMEEKKPMGGESMGKTEIEHGADGHMVTHSDGEKTGPHPTMGHAVMAIHAKHEPGPAHLMHDNGAGVTTHHVGHDGEPQGPDQHPDVDAAADHAREVMGGGMSMENMGGDMPEGMPMHGGY